MMAPGNPSPSEHAPYRFEPMTSDGLPMVRAWLAEPHVREWWGDPDEQFALVSGDLADPLMDQFTVFCLGQPFAYIQCYRQCAYPDNGLGEHPVGTRGIDQFIGKPEMTGIGHGSALTRLFVERLLSNEAPRVVTDPSPMNARAIRVYEKAGFSRYKTVNTPDGSALLMICDNPYRVTRK